MTNNEINQIFEQAIQALKDDYMFMHQSENVLHFKNKIIGIMIFQIKL